MKDQLVSFETAKLAKEKGFDELCFDAYNTHKMQYSNGWLEYIDDNEVEIPFTSGVLKPKDILAPTQSLLQRWLREVHNIQVTVTYWGKEVRKLCNHSCYECIIHKDDISLTSYYSNSYEEALEEELYEALKLIK